MTVCPVCKSVFKPMFKFKTYCSSECRSEANKSRRMEKIRYRQMLDSMPDVLNTKKNGHKRLFPDSVYLAAKAIRDRGGDI